MATLPLSKPDMHVLDQSAQMSARQVVQSVVELIGLKLTAYIAGVDDVETVDCWLSGTLPRSATIERLRLAYSVAKMLSEHDDISIVQAWLMGMNTELEDRAPIQLIREHSMAKIESDLWRAAKAFLAGA